MQYNYDDEITVVTTTIPFTKGILPIALLANTHKRTHTHTHMTSRKKQTTVSQLCRAKWHKGRPECVELDRESCMEKAYGINLFTRNPFIISAVSFGQLILNDMTHLHGKCARVCAFISAEYQHASSLQSHRWNEMAIQLNVYSNK